MSKRRVEALVFDLGGVIVAHDNPVMAARIASRCREDWGPADVGRLASQRLWGTGAPIRDLHEAMRDQGGYDADWHQFAADWCCHLNLNDAMLTYVEALARRRRVMIFSNTNQVHWEFLDAASHGRLQALEVYLSHDLGHQKPEREAYDAVAARAGLAPQTLLFFDDLAANAEAARRAGWRAEVFTTLARLRAQLAEHDVSLAD
jgi:HAD superfamily hydrolase (TIGR01509 family)